MKDEPESADSRKNYYQRFRGMWELCLVRKAHVLKATDYAVGLAIALHLNQSTLRAFPSIATLMRVTGLSKRTVIRCIQRLAKHELLKVHYRVRGGSQWGSNEYSPLL